MIEGGLFSSEHLTLWASVVIPLGSGIGWLIYRSGQNQLKIDLMWSWFSNHGSGITGYKPGDERGRRGRDT